MADTLSQEEIDALREAVKSGGSIDGEEAPRPQVSQEEVKVVSYDFRKPQIVSSDELRKLQMIHNSASKRLQTEMFSQLKTSTEVKLVAVDQISYSEFVLSLSNPAFLTLLKTDLAAGNAAMEISLPIVMTMIDIILGGTGTTETEPRELTPLERDIFRSINDIFLAELGVIWSSLTKTQFSTALEESNPEYLQLTAPGSACLSITFDLHLRDVTGVWNLCYPFEMIQKILAIGKSEDDSKRNVDKHSDDGQILRSLGVVPMTVRAEVGSCVVSAEQLGILKPGDVLCLDRRADSLLTVHVGDNLAFYASPGQRHGKAAVKLTQQASAKRPANAQTANQQS